MLEAYNNSDSFTLIIMDVSKDAPQNPFKRSRINQDPDYDEAAPPDEKRLKYLEDQGKVNM